MRAVNEWFLRTIETMRGSLLIPKRLLDTSYCCSRHYLILGRNKIGRLCSTLWSIKLINSPLWFFSFGCLVVCNHRQAAPHPKGRRDSFLSRVRYSVSLSLLKVLVLHVKDTPKDEEALTRTMGDQDILFLFSKNLENHAFAFVHLTFFVSWIVVEESFIDVHKICCFKWTDNG